MAKKQEQLSITLSKEERELLQGLAKQRGKKEASLAAQFVRERLNHVFDMSYALKK